MDKIESITTENDQPSEKLDFSGLFKIDTLIKFDVTLYSFYEVGLKKCMAVASADELVFIYVNSEEERVVKKYPWNFKENPVNCMCFEPTGTWLVIVNQRHIILVPFLPVFFSQDTFDLKWSLRELTKLDLGVHCKPSSVVWWLTKESENVLILSLDNGTIFFFTMDSQSIVGESKIASNISELQICFDDSLDLLALIISDCNNNFWKLILEHRSLNYNWLTQCRAQLDKKEGFISYIKQLSKDKITLFSQSTSKDKDQTIEYMVKPADYVPHISNRGANKCTLTAQYVNGHHFLAVFSVQTGSLILKSVKNENYLHYQPIINREEQYIQGLWTKRIIYLLQNDKIELHSSAFAIVEEGNQKTQNTSLMWSSKFEGFFLKAYLMSVREIASANNVWKEPTFLCDLQLPRFNLHPCLVVTSKGVFLISTVGDPCEYIVRSVCGGGAHTERASGALGVALPPVLGGAADWLLARGKLPPAHYLYTLAQYSQDGWLARLGVFGRIKELSNLKQTQISNVTGSSLILKFLADLLKCCNEPGETLNHGNKLYNLKTAELKELSCFAANLGLWGLLPIFNIQQGQPSLLLSAMKTRANICRGALNVIIKQKNLVPLLEDDAQFLFDFISEKCSEFDIKLLKHLCLWLCPLQEDYRPVLRDLRQGISTKYTEKIKSLINTFITVCSSIDNIEPNPNIITELPTHKNELPKKFIPNRTISSGSIHWAIVDGGEAKVFGTDVPIYTKLVGRVLDIACGKHHTLVLTENGIYASGDNTFGQLGVGMSWSGGVASTVGDVPRGGMLVRVGLGMDDVTRVAAGHYHSAAITDSGKLYTWGWGIHGQLGLNSIENQFTPQLVTAFKGQKVNKVCLGTSHTLMLCCGKVYAAGSGWGGQLGGPLQKWGTPKLVTLSDTVTDIAAGHYHNLALTEKGEIWCWGASPQSIRAAASKLLDPSTPAPISLDPSLDIPPPPPDFPNTPRDPQTPPDSPQDPQTPPQGVNPPKVSPNSYEGHLFPSLVDTRNVVGDIVQISAGCHHSALVTSRGAVYTWGLNFDGQLGSGKRKQIQIPTEATISTEMPPEGPHVTSGVPLVACGGDFTILVGHDGRIYITGNTHQQNQTEPEKTKRVIVMKRVIKVPPNRSKSKLLFQYIDKIDKIIDNDNTERQVIDYTPNPLAKLSDFKRNSWADEIIILLKPWIKHESIQKNSNMSAKFAFHTKNYSECLKNLLNSIKNLTPNNNIYLAHSENKSETINVIKEITQKTISKRIKEIGLAILNEKKYPEIPEDVFKSLFCCCEENKYLPLLTSDIKPSKMIPQDAAYIIDKCMKLFPVNSELWITCFGICKDFFVENNLPVKDLEVILGKYMKRDVFGVASAVMFSKDCQEYGEILTPNFYLNLCNEVLDSWG